jgi:hypothetical protein
MHSLFRVVSQIDIPEADLKIPKGQIDTSVGDVIGIAFAALGSIAFIIIVVSGMKFVLSRGNPDAVAKARNTIIYAAIGLVISMLSFAIVRFVVRGL